MARDLHAVSPTTPASPADSARSAPVLVTHDLDLQAEVERLAAGSGVRVTPVADDVEVIARWQDAPVMLVGADRAEAVAALRPARRADVHVVTLGAPGATLYRDAVAIGATEVVSLPEATAWLVELLALHEEPHRAAVSIAVIGGSGGAGASTFAATLAVVGARRGPTLAVDLDPGGPGLDRFLDLATTETTDALRWDALAGTAGRLSGRALREAVPRRGSLGVLTWGRPGMEGSADPPAPEVVREVLGAAARGHDTVVIDLPRNGSSLMREVVARCDLAVLLVVPTLTGVASAGRTAQVLAAYAPTAAVLRGRGLGADRVAAALGVPVVAELGSRGRRAVEDVELGIGGVRVRGGLARAAREVVELLRRSEVAA